MSSLFVFVDESSKGLAGLGNDARYLGMMILGDAAHNWIRNEVSLFFRELRKRESNTHHSNARHAKRDAERKWPHTQRYSDFILKSLEALQSKFPDQVLLARVLALDEFDMALKTIEVLERVEAERASTATFVQWDFIHETAPCRRRLEEWSRKRACRRIQFESKKNQSPLIGVVDYALFFQHKIWT